MFFSEGATWEDKTGGVCCAGTVPALRKELDTITVASEGNGFRISGVPKGMEQRVKALTLGVTATGAIERMKIEEIDGSLTEFTFSGIEENVPTKDADFTFVPPQGVGIVQGLPPV